MDGQKAISRDHEDNLWIEADLPRPWRPRLGHQVYMQRGSKVHIIGKSIITEKITLDIFIKSLVGQCNGHLPQVKIIRAEFKMKSKNLYR